MEWLLEVLDFQEASRLLTLFVPRAISATILGLVFWAFYWISARSLRVVMERAGLEPSMIRLLINNFYAVILFTLAGIMVLGQLGVNVGAALAGLGVAGLAVGLAAQNTLTNLIAGIVILWDRPFLVGDYVSTEGQYGRVTNITLRTTRIRTQENTYVVIPNAAIIDSVLVNHTKHGEIRVNVPVGIAYKESIPRAREVILVAIRDIEGIADTPAPDVVVKELGDSSVNLLVRVWIHDPYIELPTRFRVIEASKLALDEAGIQIPFPHLQLFVDDVEDRVTQKLSRLTALGGGAAEGTAS